MLLSGVTGDGYMGFVPPFYILTWLLVMLAQHSAKIGRDFRIALSTLFHRRDNETRQMKRSTSLKPVNTIEQKYRYSASYIK